MLNFSPKIKLGMLINVMLTKQKTCNTVKTYNQKICYFKNHKINYRQINEYLKSKTKTYQVFTGIM